MSNRSIAMNTLSHRQTSHYSSPDAIAGLPNERPAKAPACFAPLPRIFIALFAICLPVLCNCQKLPRTLLLTGNGNVPNYKDGYPPWIHEFHNEKIIEILKNVTTVDVSSDLSVLDATLLQQYDLVISNSLFLTPDEKQLNALYEFVSSGKSYLTLHCGILSLLNWERYEEFIGGIFIGGPSSVPGQFKVNTSNTEFWGYEYAFRKEAQHPVSMVVDDFFIKDELYHFQPSTRDFHVIARAENLPVMWWHPVGKGRVMSFTLGHDEEAKNNPGYQDLLKHGVQWLTGMPLIYAKAPRVLSTRQRTYENFMTLSATTYENSDALISFKIEKNTNPEIFTVESVAGKANIKLSGKPGNGQVIISATSNNGRSSIKEYFLRVVEDGTGNIAAYHGNTATSSSNENQSPVFDAGNVLDDDLSSRWSSAPTDTAWLSIDLQKLYPVRKIILVWEASFATAYDLSGSSDGRTWHNLVSIADGDGETDVFDFNPVPIRYLKIHATKRANSKWGYSLYEIKIFQR
jgi:type 1 glutamine amidotransferase